MIIRPLEASRLISAIFVAISAVAPVVAAQPKGRPAPAARATRRRPPRLLREGRELFKAKKFP